MEGVKSKINQAIEKGAETSEYFKAYLHSQIQLQKLSISRIAGESGAKLVQIIVSGILLSMMVFFLFLALSIWLAEILDSYVYAFLIIAGTILLLFVMFSLLKNLLVTKPITKRATKAFFKEDLPTGTEEELKQQVQQLERLLEESTKDIPDSLQELSVKDFFPDEVTALSNNILVRGIGKLIKRFGRS